jgi:FMN phosphatase YigB (HAD superfamily)
MWQGQGRPLRALIFDVDGTLYDQSRLRRAVLMRMVRCYAGQPVQGLRTMRILLAYRRAQERMRGLPHIAGDLAESQVDAACDGAAWTPAQVRLAVGRWMELEPLSVLSRCVYKDLAATLARAKDDGLRLGVFSDYPAEEKLKSLSIRTYFDVVVCAQDWDVQRFKPDSRGIRVALDRLGLGPEDAAYVGDRPDVDLPAAAALGMPFLELKDLARCKQ